MAKEAYKPMEEKMTKTLNVLKDEFAAIRAGRANPHVLDKITVDYYGAPTPVAQLGNVSVPEARLILIQPWETSILKEIEKAILKSDLGLNPNNDGKAIRLVFPPLTEERRRDLSKQIKKYGEEAKVAIRSIRRDTIEQFKTAKKNGEVTEDDLKSAEKDVQVIHDKFIADIDKAVEAKEKELMEV